MSNLTNNSHAALSPTVLAALEVAWVRAGGVTAAMAAAMAAYPPRVGAQGWPLRWARATLAAMASAAKAARLAAAEKAAQEYWAAEAARNAAPIWGVVREYGVGHWSHCYSYSVGFGAGKMSRSEAEEAADAAYKGDKVAQSHKRAWLDFMGG